jgi:Cof subfamily protein (haloacid dehalogenase superfamily)
MTTASGVRLIATDLDGTLLGPAGTISRRTIDALRAAHAAGVVVVFASGRPPFMVDPLVAEVGAAVTHGVLANGSVVCTLPDQTVLRAMRFELAMAVGVVEQLRRHDPRYGFAIATDVGFAHQPGFARRMPTTDLGPCTDDVLAATTNASEALKLMVWHDGHDAHDLLDIVPGVVGNHVSVTHMGADCVEVGPAGIDKAAGLQWLCEHLGITADEVIAFGDEFNDHEMLRWAGRGIAMANAHEATKALCDEVTESNADDGVARAIERLLAG